MRLRHDTKASAEFMFSVVDLIGILYGERFTKDHKFSKNNVVRRMRNDLRGMVENLMEDTASGMEGKLPDKKEIYAMAFARDGFQLSDKMREYFRALGQPQWDRILGPDSSTSNAMPSGSRASATSASKDLQDDNDVSFGEPVGTGRHGPSLPDDNASDARAPASGGQNTTHAGEPACPGENSGKPTGSGGKLWQAR